MEIIQIVGLGLITAIIAMVVRGLRPELAVLVSICAGIILFLMVISKIEAVIDVLRDLSSRAGVDMLYIGTILKIVGIAYIADFGAQVCRDVGESAVAAKIEFAAKVLVLVLAIPIVAAVLESLLKIIP